MKYLKTSLFFFFLSIPSPWDCQFQITRWKTYNVNRDLWLYKLTFWSSRKQFNLSKNLQALCQISTSHTKYLSLLISITQGERNLTFLGAQWAKNRGIDKSARIMVFWYLLAREDRQKLHNTGLRVKGSFNMPLSKRIIEQILFQNSKAGDTYGD